MEIKYDATIAWNLHWKCNLNCEYCINPEQPFKNLETIKINYLLKNLDKSGKTFHIIFSGGEPFLCPNFIESIKELTKKHYVSIYTNLTSYKIKEFSEKINNNKIIYIAASFHYNELKKRNLLEVYFKNFKNLKNRGFNIILGEVAYPPIINDLQEYKNFFKDYNNGFVYQIFWGRFLKKKYPFAYTKKQLNFLGVKDKNSLINSISSFNKICNAGYNYIYIDPLGDIYPCASIPIKLGNIYNNFYFNDYLIKCKEKYCMCKYRDLDPKLFNIALKNQKKIKIIRRFNDKNLFYKINRKFGEIGIVLNRFSPKTYQVIKKVID